MNDTNQCRLRRSAGLVASVIALALLAPRARADDLVGLYFGGGVGESRIEATLPDVSGTFGQTHFSYKAILGVRPIPLLGAEVQYLDLGEPGDNEASYDPVGLKLHGAAAYGMLYLPLVPIVDLYFKAGLARLQSSVTNAYLPLPPSGAFAFDRTNTSATEGLGVQYKLGLLTMRADYSFFNAAGGHQNLMTADVTWTFF